MIEQAIFAIGSAHAGLGALIGSGSAARLFPTAEETEHAVPRVVFEKDRPEAIAGWFFDSGWYHTRFRFTAYGATALQAKQVIEQVRLAYQRFHGASSGHSIDDARTTGEGSDWFDLELGQFAEEFELEFFHN
jgi:hypothetical protein